MAPEDEVAIRQLPGAFDRLTTALHDGARRRRVAVIAFIVLLVVGLGGSFLQSRSNGRVLKVINSVTGPEAQKRSAVATAEILRRNAIETDCRDRRRVAGLPAPQEPPPAPPDLTPAELLRFLAPYSCVGQTDPSIYPGAGAGTGDRP